MTSPRELRPLDVLYLSACDWDAPWHGPQEIASRLGADGHRVTYVETLGRRRPRAGDIARAARRIVHGSRRRGGEATPPAPGVTLVSPVVVPGARGRVERAVNKRLLRRALRGVAGAEAPDILWIYTPTALALDLAADSPADLILYHCTQSHRHRPWAPRDAVLLEDQLMRRADLVITDAIELHRERAARHPRVLRIPSGVNPWSDDVPASPDWSRSLPKPVIGYLGSIDHRVDLGLVDAVSRAHPDWSVVLVGPVGDAPVQRLSSLPNVSVLPQVPVGSVPGVLACFDVGMMPYADRTMTRYTYPAKLHQYLAAGLPIASTPLPDLEEFPGLAEIGTGRAGFTAAVERALEGPPRKDERREVARRNTWESRYAQIMDAVSESLDAVGR